MFTILQKSLFKKQVKKLHQNQKQDLEKAIKEVANNPSWGKKKKGKLSHIYVYKFQMCDQVALLAYKISVETSSIYLLAVGSHENFYRDLERCSIN